MRLIPVLTKNTDGPNVQAVMSLTFYQIPSHKSIVAKSQTKYIYFQQRSSKSCSMCIQIYTFMYIKR